MSMNRTLQALAVLMALAISVPVATAKSPNPARTLVQKLAPGTQIVREFKGPMGLDGFVLHGPAKAGRKSRYGVVYVTASGKFAFAGAIYDATGKDVARSMAERYIPKPDLRPLLDAVRNKTSYFSEGAAKAPHFFAFFDPNCIYCNMLWKQTRDAVKAGQLRISWVPVAILKKTSMGRAVAILAAKDPVIAMREDEAHFDHQSEQGAMPPDAGDPEVRAKVKANTAFFMSNNMQGTPTLVYRDQSNKIHVIPGLPSAAGLKQILSTALPQ